MENKFRTIFRRMADLEVEIQTRDMVSQKETQTKDALTQRLQTLNDDERHLREQLATLQERIEYLRSVRSDMRSTRDHFESSLQLRAPDLRSAERSLERYSEDLERDQSNLNSLRLSMIRDMNFQAAYLDRRNSNLPTVVSDSVVVDDFAEELGVEVDLKKPSNNDPNGNDKNDGNNENNNDENNNNDNNNNNENSNSGIAGSAGGGIGGDDSDLVALEAEAKRLLEELTKLKQDKELRQNLMQQLKQLEERESMLMKAVSNASENVLQCNNCSNHN